MKNIGFLVVLCGGMLLSQLAQSQTSSPEQQSGQNSSMIRGCLSGSNGTYVITQDKTGTTYTLIASESQMRQLGTMIHHQVELTGKPLNASGQSGSTGQSSPSPGGQPNTHDFEVSSVQDISNECTGMNPPPARTTPGNEVLPK